MDHSVTVGLRSLQLENSVLELLASNMSRFNEEEESDRQGLFHTLGIFENVVAFRPALSRILLQKTTLLKFLLERIKAKKHDENRGYASELLAIVLQDNRENRLQLGKEGGVDIVLQVLSVRKVSSYPLTSAKHSRRWIAIPEEGPS